MHIQIPHNWLCFKGNARKTRGWGIQFISIFRHTHIVSYNFQPDDPEKPTIHPADFPISPSQIAILMGPKNCDVQTWQCVKTLYPCSSHQNSWDLWMFIPLKMVFS
jgi:hypothetical protein